MNKQELLKNLEKKGFGENILKPLRIVKREDFLPDHLELYAYEDTALPLEEGAALSQPSTIAFMLSLLEIENKNKILEIGSGSGYVLALLSISASEGEVFGIEVNRTLALQSKERLKNFERIHLIQRNGFRGLPEREPFDRILISASCKKKPIHLLSQLKEDGILVAPVGNSIIKIKKVDGKLKEEIHEGFSFVPLIEDD